MEGCINEKAFHQICDKSSTTEIKSMKWSPTSDLVAVIGKEGDFRIHRLYWQRVWSLQEKDCAAQCTAWHPEGKMVAVGYSSGLIKLLEVEKGILITAFDIGASVLSLDWPAIQDDKLTEEMSSVGSRWSSFEFVYELVTLAENDEKAKGGPSSKEKMPRLLLDSKKPNILFAGSADGYVTLLQNGALPLAKVAIPNVSPDIQFTMSSTLMSCELATMSVAYSCVTASDDKHFRVAFFDSGLLASRISEIASLGRLFLFINCLVDMCNKVITQMSDSWEDILLRISSKLNKLDEMLPSNSSVADEFLVAFVCGTATDELQAFLLHDLTLKGLKTLGNNVTTCYKEIEELVMSKLEVYCHALLQCLAELHGMARWYDRYGILGLSEDLIQTCITSLGALSLKVRELIQVINSDLKNFRAFFRWVTGLVLRLSNETAQRNLKEFSQEHYARILYFLQTHLKKNEKDPHFQLERVGQYLSKDKLHLQMDFVKNPWYNFISESHKLKESSLVMLPSCDSSLIAAFSVFKTALINAYEQTAIGITKSIEYIKTADLVPLHGTHVSECHPSISQRAQSSNKMEILFMPCACKQPSFYRLQISYGSFQMHVQEFAFNPMDPPFYKLRGFTDLVIREVAYFDADSIIVLARCLDSESMGVDVLCQVSLSSQISKDAVLFAQDVCLSSQTVQNVNSEIIKGRTLDINEATYLSVSGARRVASVLSRTSRRVQIFDIAADEEDEDADASHMTEDELS